MESVVRGTFFNLEYEFDISEKKLSIVHNGETYCKELLDTKNDKLFQAFREGKVFLDTNEKDLFLDKTLYFCSRSIVKTFSCDTEIYMDMLIYNDEKDVIYPGALNRSQGHCNKKLQIEYHQVLMGQIISVMTSPDGVSYYGFFSEGDYIHVPKGWFHCTYVTKGPAIVANFYCNTPWGDHVECKPYFEIENNFSFEYGDSENVYMLKKKGIDKGVLISANEKKSFEEFHLFEYTTLYQNGIVREKYPCKNIFDFIYQIDLKEE